MRAFEVAQLAAEQAARDQRYYEFIRIPALSMGRSCPRAASIRRVRTPRTRSTTWSAGRR